METIISKAAEANIPRKKFSERSKPWWSDKLNRLRKNLATARRKWKKTQNEQAYKGFSRARAVYFQEIKSAKTQCWNQFLEEARNKDIFKACQYVKQRKVEKLLIIKFETEEGPEKAVTFNQKYKAFIKTLFIQPPQSETLT